MGQEKCLGQELLAQHCSHFGCLNPQFYQEKHGKTVDNCKPICKVQTTKSEKSETNLKVTSFGKTDLCFANFAMPFCKPQKSETFMSTGSSTKRDSKPDRLPDQIHSDVNCATLKLPVKNFSICISKERNIRKIELWNKNKQKSLQLLTMC